MWREAQKSTSPRISVFDALKAPGLGVTVALTLMNACTMFAWWGFNTWVPSYLLSPAIGLSGASMNGFIIAMQAGMWLGYVTFGFISDAVGRKRTYVGVPGAGGGVRVRVRVHLEPDGAVGARTGHRLLSRPGTSPDLAR